MRDWYKLEMELRVLDKYGYLDQWDRKQ